MGRVFPRQLKRSWQPYPSDIRGRGLITETGFNTVRQGFIGEKSKLKSTGPISGFFGYPRKSQLIETLIHEVRHRVSPALGHNEMFYQLVNRDTQCALEHW